jgi:rhodanese-related sulfurtransferase
LDPPPGIDLEGGFFILGQDEADAVGKQPVHRLQVGRVPNREKQMGVSEIRVEELKQRLDAGENLFLLDVRDESEYEISNIGGQLIPLPELSKRVHELDASRNIVAVCKMGSRSQKAVKLLHNAGFNNVWNLAGGIHAWSDRIDHRVRKY